MRLPALGGGPLGHQVPYGGGEARVGADGGGPAHRQAQLRRLGRGLGVEVIEDLHVVRHEPDGRHHDGGHALAVQLLQVVADVGLQPWDVRGAGAGLVDQPPRVVDAGPLPYGVGDQLGDVQVLAHVRAALPVLLDGARGVGGRDGDGVRAEREVGAVAHVLGEVCQRLQDALDHGFDEAGVVEVVPQLVDPRRLEPLPSSVASASARFSRYWRQPEYEA